MLDGTRISGTGKTMSRVFEALKQAELAEAKRREYQNVAPVIPAKPNRRRTQRIRVKIPLFVYGHTPKDGPFCDEACTTEINAHGGSIRMQTPVQPGQPLLLTNKTNQETQQCLVLSIAARLGNDTEVAFEFLAPSPQFWRTSAQKPTVKKSPKKRP
jgi:hypothetical protein